MALEDDDSEKNLDVARRQERARRKAEAADFVDLLLALAEQRDLPIYVALTMRTDFLGDCDLFYGLPEALNRGRYLVPRMTREQLRDAVECPALLLGAEIAPRLLDHVLNELGDRFDRLPVLQHALLRTWDAWQRAGSVGPVDLRHFESAGGLEGALDQDAEGALRGTRHRRHGAGLQAPHRHGREPAPRPQPGADQRVDGRGRRWPRRGRGDCPPLREGWPELPAPVRRWEAG